MREKLPNKRKIVTQRLKIGGQTIHFSVGMYDDGRPGELFIDMHKTGTYVRAWCSSTAKLVSLMLQYGVPLSELVEALVGQCSEPFGRVPVTGHKVITDTSGVLDAVMRAMALEFLANEGADKSFDAKCLSSLMRITESMDAAEIYELAEEAGEVDTLSSFTEKFSDNYANS